jgi:hypothetical protein
MPLGAPAIIEPLSTCDEVERIVIKNSYHLIRRKAEVTGDY